VGRIILIAEKLYSDNVCDLKHQADFIFRAATLDFLQGPPGNPCPTGQFLLGYLVFFPAKPDEFAQQFCCIPDLTEICAINRRGHKSLLDIIVVTELTRDTFTNFSDFMVSCTKMHQLF